jgi:hypothetical protein
MELRHSKDWAILNDELICVTKREVSMQPGEIMWKRHWQMARWRKFGVWQSKNKREGGESGGEEKLEKVVIQGLANPESGTCEGNLSHTSDPVSSRVYDRDGGEGRIKT